LALSIPDDEYSNKIPWAPNKTFIIEDYDQNVFYKNIDLVTLRDRRDRHRLLVGFTTICAIITYHH
jgi:hypothetical protein